MRITHFISGRGLGGLKTVFLNYQKVFETLGYKSIALMRKNADLLNANIPK